MQKELLKVFQVISAFFRAGHWNSKLQLNCLLVIFACLVSSGAFAQTKVSGKVTDEKNLPVSGATVSVKGGTGGTQTDANGNYTITVKDAATVLVFRYLGYNNQEFTVGTRNVINV